MSSSRFFGSPLASPRFNSVPYLLESRAHDIVQQLTTTSRSAQPEEIALESVLAGASSMINATREADILGIVNSGFFKTVLGDIGDSFRSEVILYTGKIFEHFWTTEYSKGEQINSLKGVSGRALCALIGRLTAMEYLPYEHFRAFASQLVKHFRTQEHLECLLVMFRYASSLRAEYFIEDERFLLSIIKVLCVRSSAVFVREAPEADKEKQVLLHEFDALPPQSRRDAGGVEYMKYDPQRSPAYDDGWITGTVGGEGSATRTTSTGRMKT
ncbi:hypothetical protein M413DRAFT_13900 [Hebeloma cylindrosporum]|uniref:Uncharacterized protein n=1 Tax=Hebeloma cylindrosporum TaxID=76867 RepID=A0A0C3BYN1_HEBCY|nr:hypothetical protein M413DRAFT_13900 [Hebeloma cylindrosporum h7]